MMKKLTAIVLAFSLLSGCTPKPDDEHIHVDQTRAYDSSTIEINGIDISIVEYSLIYSEYHGKRPDGKGYFFLVRFRVTNNALVMRTINLGNTAVITNSGYKYTLENYGIEGITHLNKVEYNLDPEETQYGTIAFELPSGTTPDSLIIIDPTDPDRSSVIDIPRWDE